MFGRGLNWHRCSVVDGAFLASACRRASGAMSARRSRPGARRRLRLARRRDRHARHPRARLQMAVLRVVVAQFERERIIERVKAGLARARAQDQRLGRRRQRVNGARPRARSPGCRCARPASASACPHPASTASGPACFKILPAAPLRNRRTSPRSGYPCSRSGSRSATIFRFSNDFENADGLDQARDDRRPQCKYKTGTAAPPPSAPIHKPRFERKQSHARQNARYAPRLPA